MSRPSTRRAGCPDQRLDDRREPGLLAGHRATPDPAASLAIAGLTIVGLTAHEISLEHAVGSVEHPASEHEGKLAAAA